MSKRGAEFYLTDRNFDSYNEEVDDDEEGNVFKRASPEVLSKRKIKPLRRRARAAIKSSNSDKPSSLSSFSFKTPSATPVKPFTTSTTTTSTNSTPSDSAMKEKVKKFTEQICGLNKSFMSFLSNSIKEDIVFDISLNIGQYQEKRKSIEREFADVINYLTNNKSALKPETTTPKSNFTFSTPSTTNTTTTTTSSAPTFSFTKPSNDSKETSSFKFGFGSNNTTSSNTTTTTTKSTFTFNLNKDNEKDKSSTTTTTKPTFTFNLNKDNDKDKSSTTTTTKPTFTFNLNKDNDKDKSATTKTPTFTFPKPDNNTTTTAPTFTFKKPEENKDESSSKPTVPTFKPFTFNFGQKMAESTSGDQGKTLPKPNFSFGVAPPSKAEIAAAAATSTEEDEEENSEQAQLTTGAGEEDEDTVYEVKAKVHHYDMNNKKYVSRGVGLLKINKNKKTNKSRLLGRMDNGSVFLNVSLFKEMVVSEPVNTTQFTFNAMDRLEGSDEIKMIRFAVRVKDKESAKKII
jgi:nucleoporin NUP2